MTLNDLIAGREGSFFLADLYNYARMVRPKMTECGTVTRVRETYF